MENFENEIWKQTDIPGYHISNLGRLKGRSGKILKTKPNHNGYHTMCLKPNGRKGKCECIRIHILVAKAFIPNPDNKPQVNHIDGNKNNNRADNLEWCTNQENMIHAYRHGLVKLSRGEDRWGSKLTNEQVKWIRKYYIPRDRQFGTRALGRKFGMHHSTIEDIVNNKSYIQ